MMQVLTPMQYARAFVMAVPVKIYTMDVFAVAAYVHSELQERGLADPDSLQRLASQAPAYRAQALLDCK